MPSNKDAVQVKTKEDAEKLIDKYDHFLFDCDGVIWTGPAGDKLTDNIVETLSFLREKGKHVAFVTNNATSSRKQFQKKFKDFGIDVELSDIVTSGSATAQHLKEEILPKREREGKKTGIYLIGQEAIEEELRECGLKWKGGTCMEDDVLLKCQDFSSIEPDEEVGVVLYSFQMRINYKQLAKAYNYIAQNEGCQLILTNDDMKMNLHHGGFAPGEGALAAVLLSALPEGEKPLIVGKPNQPLLDIAQAALKFEPSRTLFTGDRLGTDISFAKRGGLDSLLVLSGLQTKEEAYDLKGKDQPEWIAECVGKLLMAKGE